MVLLVVVGVVTAITRKASGIICNARLTEYILCCLLRIECF